MDRGKRLSLERCCCSFGRLGHQACSVQSAAGGGHAGLHVSFLYYLAPSPTGPVVATVPLDPRSPTQLLLLLYLLGEGIQHPTRMDLHFPAEPWACIYEVSGTGWGCGWEQGMEDEGGKGERRERQAQGIILRQWQNRVTRALWDWPCPQTACTLNFLRLSPGCCNPFFPPLWWHCRSGVSWQIFLSHLF